MVVQNLPRAVRFKPENLIVVATIPGPNEPSCDHLNSYLEPLVDELLKFWQGVQFKVPHSMFRSRLVRGALSYITCDMPATRKVCGFYGNNAHYGCSKCLKYFPNSHGLNVDYSGFDRDSWPKRKMSDHFNIAYCAKAATTKTMRLEVEREAGIRYSELLCLPYLDIDLIDPMHNLFLGTSKLMLSLWKQKEYITCSDFDIIQEKVDAMNSPGNIGRIPGKISSGFSGFTAKQLMVWTIMYSPVVLYGILPREHYEHWCVFSSACSYLCKPYISRREVNRADELLVKFCGEFEHLYGKEACTPNLHMHMHLKDCILDAGPVYTFWCFSFEKYNGMLGGMNKSWRLPEQQLIHRFQKFISNRSIITWNFN